MKVQTWKRDALFWALVICLSAIYFVFNRALYKNLLDVRDIELLGLIFHLGQWHRFVFAGFQWLILLWYLQVYVKQEQLKTMTWFVFGLFLLDAGLIPLVKLGVAKPFPFYIHGIFHKAIKYMASGLFAVMATVFIKFIKKMKPVDKNVLTEPEILTEENKSINYTPIPLWWRWLFRVVFVIAVVVCSYLLFTNRFKLSGIVYLLGLMGIGFQLRWNMHRFRKIKTSILGYNLALCWLYGLYGVWEDFFTGGIYFLCGFFILLLTNSIKNQSVFRSLILAVYLIFSMAAWFMFFLFDVF